MEATKGAVWSRQMALERLQRINDDNYQALTQGQNDEVERLTNAVYFRDRFNAFIQTLDRLNDMTNVVKDDPESVHILFVDRLGNCRTTNHAVVNDFRVTDGNL